MPQAGGLEGRLRDLGEFIREQRRAERISLRKLSELAGISNPYLSQIERGLRKPSAEILQAIARGLSISAETLYVADYSGKGLAKIDTTALTLQTVGPWDQLSGAAELTGTGDGRLFGFFQANPIIIAAGNDSLFVKLASALGKPEMAKDPRYLTNDLRNQNVDVLKAEIEAVLKTRPVGHWMDLLDAAGIPAFRVHAGMPKPDREAALSRFAASANGVLLTTSAHAPDSGLPHLGERPEDEPKIGFGQSAPRADLRFVVHHQAPASLEQYACEVTWVGRDGQGGVALMLFDSAQLSLNDAILEQQRLREKQVLALLRALETFQRNGQVPQAKPLTVEWLALNSGLSRRTSERLVLLLADSGVLRRTPEGVRTVADGKVLSQAAEALARDLERLREGDRARLAAVERLADSSECRRRVFLRYFAGESGAPCGICSTCQRGKPRGRVAAEQVAPGLR